MSNNISTAQETPYTLLLPTEQSKKIVKFVANWKYSETISKKEYGAEGNIINAHSMCK